MPAYTKSLKKYSRYILSGSFCIPSAKVLRDAVEEVTGEYFPITTKDGFAPNAILRYGGNIMPLKGDTDNNSIERINILANKLTFSRLLLDAGFYTPEFNQGSAGQAQALFNAPIIVRSTLTGFGGEGITVCRTLEELRRAWESNRFYWTPFVSMDSEYRVHVANGNVLKVFEKVREEGLEEEEYPIRNNARGYHFSLQSKPRCGESIRRLVKELAEKVPLLASGFFALDIGWIAKEKRIFIIEGNSAPGLNEETALVYAKALFGGNNSEVNDEVLRSTTHPSRIGEPNSANPVRHEHNDPPVRTEWSW